ncbi:hypothetical protein [Paraburkholderia sp. MM6662-R1]|uniref:hypothetical protein n=1 Tax=Paraburkholderia sp. MM6662-R1 TaxID=2991066 RepID=UPI003D23FE2B
MLLPLSAKHVCSISLGYHLALATCRGTGGTLTSMDELTRAVYLSYCLGKLGYGCASEVFYRDAEAHLEIAIRHAIADGGFHLGPHGATAAVLRVLDGQLASAQTLHVVEAGNRLARWVAGTYLKSSINVLHNVNRSMCSAPLCGVRSVEA